MKGEDATANGSAQVDSEYGKGSALNEAARELLAHAKSNTRWREALEGLLKDFPARPSEGPPLNQIYPRLRCYRHELLPPAAFAELLRLAFAPNLRVRAAVSWLVARESPVGSQEVLLLLRDWQQSVLSPFADHLESKAFGL